MKKTLIGIVSFFVLLNSFAMAKMQPQELEKEFAKCMQNKTSECFRLLYSKSQNNIVRYNYGVSLYSEKEYQLARKVLSDFIMEDRDKHIELVQNSKMLIKRIDEQYKDKVKASAFDNGNYLNEISKTAKWKNPGRIRVYIEKTNDGKDRLFRNALQTWSNRVMEINFSYELYPDNADIICKYVDSINQDKVVGLTEAKSFLTNINTGERYFNPPVTVTISRMDTIINRQFTDKELESVILHELGHALGILDHSKSKNDIMFYSTETYKNSQISNRDVNTIRAIYEKK